MALGDLKLVASVTDFSIYLVFVAVNLTVILLRFWQPNRRRPFKIRGTVAKVPVAPVLALGAVALLLPSLETTAIALGSLVITVGLAIYAVLRRLRPPTPDTDPA